MPNPDKTPKEKANQYKTEKETAADGGKQTPPRALDAWDDIIGQRIEEAMRQGAFDNLPGRGKPQTLRRNPLVPADQALAFDILQNNDLAPAWIADRGAMFSAIEQWRTGMRDTAIGYQTQQQAASGEPQRQQWQRRWESQLQRWDGEIRDLNKRINTLNLQLPIARLEIYKLVLDDELRRVGMTRTL